MPRLSDPAPPPPAVSLYDVALEAGVSQMTASRCLRNSPLHSEATRARVRAAAEKVGYVPDPVISRLMVHLRRRQPAAAGNVIAFVGHYPVVTLRGSATWRRFEEGAKQRCARLGYSWDWFPLENYQGVRGLSRLRGVLTSRRIEGVILFPLSGDRAFAFDPAGFVIATLGFRLRQPALHEIAHNHYLALHETLRALARRGYERIALAFPEGFDPDEKWRSAIAAIALDTGRTAADACHRCAPFPAAESPRERARFHDWIDAARPDLVLGLPPFDRWWREDLRARRPRIDYASLDWAEDMIDLAGIDQMSEHLGAGAVDLVVAHLQRNERGEPPFQKTLHAGFRWHEGPSVRRPPEKSPTLTPGSRHARPSPSPRKK